MDQNSSQIVPFLLAALIVWSVYRRLRRSFGKQRLYPVLMGMRIGLLLLIACVLLLPSVVRSTPYLEGLVVGLCAGIALALWGASRTRYLREDGQLFFVPHTYTGLAVSLLFLGRLVYRAFQFSSAGPQPASFAASMVSSPLTFGLFYVLVGYYVCYYSVVLRKSKHLTPEELIAPAPLAQR